MVAQELADKLFKSSPEAGVFSPPLLISLFTFIVNI
jgi:hypothetical protein